MKIFDAKKAMVGVLEGVASSNKHTPTTMSLYDAITTDKYKMVVQAIRAEIDESKQKAMKEKLPCFFASGYYDKADSFVHNGFIVLDIDEHDNKDISMLPMLGSYLKGRMHKGDIILPYVSMCARSCRGKGIMMVIPIADTSRHKEHYKTLVSMFARAGIKVDEACANINRKRFFSYDENVYYNPDAIPFDGVEKNALKIHSEGRKASSLITNHAEDLTQVRLMYERLKANSLEYCPDYESYQQLALILAPTFGEKGRDAFHAISALSDNYSEADADKRYDDALIHSDGKVKLGTFFRKASEILRDNQITTDFSNI